MGAHPQGTDEIIPSWAPDRDALAWEADGIVLMEEGAEPVTSRGRTASPFGRPTEAPRDHTDSIVVMDLDGTVQMTVEGPASDFAWQPLFE